MKGEQGFESRDQEFRQNLLDGIAILTAQHGYGPSITDLARFAGRPRMTTYHHVGLLHRAGLVTHEPGTRRTLRLTPAGRARVSRVRAL
jgi:DNA-binding IclR family transcriptional regulator